jgi:hypothetical protein
MTAIGFARGALQKAGAEIANAWLALLALVLLLSFQFCGIVACLALWIGGAALLRGLGWFGIAISGVFAYGFGLFLSTYVWAPHVKKAVMKATDALSR